MYQSHCSLVMKWNLKGKECRDKKVHLSHIQGIYLLYTLKLKENIRGEVNCKLHKKNELFPFPKFIDAYSR